MIRITGPAQLVGWPVIHGNEWENGNLHIWPERISASDAVIIQRDFPRHVDAYKEVIAEARAQDKVIVYEIDDLLSELPEVHPDFHQYKKVRASILTAIIEADAVTCSTPAIAEYVRDFNPHVWVLPNYLNDNLWHLRTITRPTGGPADKPLTIGYLGTHSHRPDLEMVIPTLVRILERYGDAIRLRLWGISPQSDLIGRNNVEWLSLGMVDYAQFASYFSKQECDIFIAPLLDNQFNRSKSSLKFLEYSVLGVAGVYSQIKPYESVVVQGVNGFLANTPDEWEVYLTRLIENPDLRYQMGLEAQATLKRDWLLSDQAPEWASTFEKLYTSIKEVQKSKTEGQIAKKYFQWQREDEAEIANLKAKIADLKTSLVENGQAIQELNETISEKDLLIHIYNEQIGAIHNSTGWKLLEALYKIRLILAPRGSRRERLLHLTLQSLSVLKNLGLRAMLSWWRSILANKGVVEPVSQPQVPTAQPIKGGETCPIPTISVVIEESVLKPVLDRDEVSEWVNQQTLKSTELVLWERDAGTAQVLASPENKWQASDAKKLCQGLSGRYICMASDDLLQQGDTYLEENLAALESEALIFTVNTLGYSHWATRHLHLARLPGHQIEPLFRLVVRKEYVQDDFSLDLPSRVGKMQGKPSVVGKVIPHTTSITEPDDAFILDTKIGDVDAVQRGRHILARARADGEWETAANILYTSDSVLPVTPEPSGDPTVFLIMPFLAVGGAEQLALHILSNLKDKMRFVVIALDELDPALGTLTDAFRYETPYVYSIPDFLDLSLRTSFLWYLIEQYQPVTLYIANGAALIYDLLPEIKRRYPRLRTVNQVYDYEAGWINRYDLSLVMALDAHIGANQKICEAYINRGARPEQVHLVEHAIDPSGLNPDEYSPEKVNEVKHKLGLPAENRVVTFASRIHPQKRPMDFVEMARRFSGDPSISFLMMGDGPMAHTVDEQIRKAGLSNFHRHNFYRPISDILAISDVVVLPSEYEGMPLIVAEAQIMGKPVVVTEVGNNREVLEITQGGVVVPQIGDIVALMGGVREMLESPPDPNQVREAFVSHFGIDIIAEKYHAVLIGTPHD